MKKFLIKVCVFFVILFVVDVALGFVLSSLVTTAKQGDNGRNNYICNETNEDILIIGSSRAARHYNPEIITDSLGMSCYNCGQDGNGIILNYGRLHLISQRYHPKVLIYDVIPMFDLLQGEDNHKYLGWLRAYYDREGIPEIFNAIDKTEKYKMKSQMYRFNSKFTQIIMDHIHPMQTWNKNGFYPMNQVFDSMAVSKREENEEIFQYDSLKIHFLNKMLDEFTDTKVIFIASPFYEGTDTTAFSIIKGVCQERKIPFIDYSNNSKYVHKNKLFADGLHLNVRGADEYTRDIIEVIRKSKLL